MIESTVPGQPTPTSMTPIALSPSDLVAPTNTSPTIIDKPDWTLEYKTFEKGTPAAGFGFFSIAYKSVQAAVSKMGEEALLGLINSATSQGLRTKAKFRLPDQDEPDASNPDKAAALAAVVAKQVKETADLLVSTKGILLNETDAEAFVPGSRGAVTAQGLIKEAKAALKDGNKELAGVKFKLAMEALAQEQLKAMEA